MNGKVEAHDQSILSVKTSVSNLETRYLDQLKTHNEQTKELNTRLSRIEGRLKIESVQLEEK